MEKQALWDTNRLKAEPAANGETLLLTFLPVGQMLIVLGCVVGLISRFLFEKKNKQSTGNQLPDFILETFPVIG